MSTNIDGRDGEIAEWTVVPIAIVMAVICLVGPPWLRISGVIVLAAGWMMCELARRAGNKLIEHYKTWGVEPNSNGKMPSIQKIREAASKKNPT